MTQTRDRFITLLNGEAAAIPPHRRVKIHSTPTQIVFADESDGDSWIGVTVPQPGGNVAVGKPVTVQLRGESHTIKVECSEAIENGDALYPADDGKVSDTAGTVVIGTALDATSASGGIVEMLPNAGSGAVPDEESVANADATTGAGIPIVLRRSGITASGTAAIGKPARPLQIIDAAIIQLGTTDTNVTLINAGTTFTNAAAAGTAAGKRTAFTTYTAAQLNVPATAALTVNLSTADAGGVEVIVTCLPVAAS